MKRLLQIFCFAVAMLTASLASAQTTATFSIVEQDSLETAAPGSVRSPWRYSNDSTDLFRYVGSSWVPLFDTLYSRNDSLFYVKFGTERFAATISSSGGVSDGDKGDITVASGVWSIDNDAVDAAAIAADAVDTDELAADAVTAAKIGTGEVGADELASTAVTPGSYTNTNLTVDADGRITAASNGDAVVADVVSVTFDGGRDTLDCGNKAKRIFQINMGAITRTDTIDIINSVTGGEYLNHITNVVTDTMTWPGNLLTFAGDTLKTRQYTASTVNGFSFYGDGTNFYTLAATGNAATLPDGPPVFIDTIQSLDSLILYVRSDSITGLSNGNALPSWPDLSGESNNLAERLSNANRRPTYRTGEINGKPAVDFINSLDGNEDALSTANEIFLNDSCTLFIVYNMDDALTVTEFVFSSAKSDGTNFVHRFHYNSLDSLVIGTLDNSLVSRGGAYQDRRENTWKLATVTYEPGAVSTLRVNGNPISATHSSVASAAYGENVRLSLAAAVNVTGGTTTNEADVKIALVAVYNRKLTTSEIADVETFINNAFFP